MYMRSSQHIDTVLWLIPFCPILLYFVINIFSFLDYFLGVTKGEDYLITGFLAAQNGFDECLFAAACESPQIAYEYAKAAKALIEGIEKFQG